MEVRGGWRYGCRELLFESAVLLGGCEVVLKVVLAVFPFLALAAELFEAANRINDGARLLPCGRASLDDGSPATAGPDAEDVNVGGIPVAVLGRAL